MQIVREGLTVSALSYASLVANFVFAALVVKLGSDSLYGHSVYLTTLLTFALTISNFGLPVGLVRAESNYLEAILSGFFWFTFVVANVFFVAFVPCGGPFSDATVALLISTNCTVVLAALQPVWQRIGRLALYQLIVFSHAALRVLLFLATSGSFDAVKLVSVVALIIMVACSESYGLGGFSLKTH